MGTEIQWIQEIWSIIEAWMRANLKILFVGSVVSSWSLKQKVAGLNNCFHYKKNSHWIQWKDLGKTQFFKSRTEEDEFEKFW